MKSIFTAAAIAVLGAAPALAEGDAAAGEKAFRQCQSCHVVVNDAGETLAGRNAKTGPNLYNSIGRTAGTVDGFRYSDSMVAAGEAGLVWDAASFAAYIQDPTGFLREYLDDKGARGNMSFKVRKEADAVNLAAYIESLGSAGGS